MTDTQIQAQVDQIIKNVNVFFDLDFCNDSKKNDLSIFKIDIDVLKKLHRHYKLFYMGNDDVTVQFKKYKKYCVLVIDIESGDTIRFFS